MPTYTHRCRTCGDFDVVRPMAASATSAACPGCGSGTSRVFGAPSLRALDPGVRQALDTAGASSEAPAVVTSVPGRARRATPVTRDPRHARLPRP